jgi:hypothetical protein
VVRQSSTSPCRDPRGCPYVTAQPPIFRDTGNYIVRVGHTTWTLKGVTLDTPDPDGHMRFHVEHRDLTAAEKGECAGSVVGRNAP